MTRSQQEDRRERLRSFFENGTTHPKTLSKLTGMHLRTVERVLKKLKEKGTTAREAGSGSPPALQSNDCRRLHQLAVKHNRLSNRRLATLMAEKGSPSVSRFTIGRTLKRQGFDRKLPRDRPDLKPRHIAARLAWCEENKDTNWANVVFSDESRFQFYSNIRKLLCKKRMDRGRPKYGPARMVWGGISVRGVTPLVLIKGTVNTDRYLLILEEAMIPTMSALYPDGYVFQQDNAPCHKSGKAAAWFGNSGINVLRWPANSPDLSIIENVWGWMKNELSMMTECNEEEWETRIINLWDNLSHDYLKSLFDSIPERINRCIAAKGGYIDY